MSVHNGRVRRAVRLRQAIGESGGLVAQADLARRYGLAKATINVVVLAPGFPDPVGKVGRSAVYAALEVDEFMAGHGRGHTPKGDVDGG